MRIRCTSAVVLLFSVAGWAHAADYWPLRAGVTYEYQTPEGSRLTVTYTDGASGTVFRNGNIDDDCFFSEHYTADAAGRVELLGGNVFCDGWIDPDLLQFDPPLPLLDPPLTTGKTWVWQGDYSGYGTEVGLLRATVLDETTITVPAGTFEVVPLQLSTLFGGHFAPAQQLYLHRALGPVKFDNWELVSWDGIVPAARDTWGQIKLLFQ